MCPHIPLKERSQIRKVMLQKWRRKKRKHSVYTHFTKDQNCGICLRTKITRGPCRRRNEGSIPRAEKVWLLDNSGSKSSMKEVNPGTITGTLSWYKISPLSGYNLIRVRTRIHRRRRRVHESFLSRHKSQKLCIRTIHKNLANLVNHYHGIIELPRLIAQKQKELQKREIYGEWKREHQPYCCNPDRMISGGQILWNAVAICDMSKISCQTGKIRMTEDLGNPSRTYFVLRENFGKKILWIQKNGCIRNMSQKIGCKRSPNNPQRRRNCISCGRWFSNIIRKRLRLPRTHSETGIHRKERKSQRRISRR